MRILSLTSVRIVGEGFGPNAPSRSTETCISLGSLMPVPSAARLSFSLLATSAIFAFTQGRDPSSANSVVRALTNAPITRGIGQSTLARDHFLVHCAKKVSAKRPTTGGIFRLTGRRGTDGKKKESTNALSAEYASHKKGGFMSTIYSMQGGSCDMGPVKSSPQPPIWNHRASRMTVVGECRRPSFLTMYKM